MRHFWALEKTPVSLKKAAPAFGVAPQQR